MAVYTLFGQPASPATIQSDQAHYNIGLQFSVSINCAAMAIWFYSALGAGELPTDINIFQVTGVGTGTLVHTETATWSGAAGSGWVRATFSNPPVLTTSNSYKACVNGGDGTAKWYSATNHYWDTGGGQNGISSGILTAPNSSGGDGGQDTYIVNSGIAYPTTEFLESNYWIDIEVSDIYVVQSVAGGQGTSSLNFNNAITNGNSIAIIAQGYGGTAGSSNPTYNGIVPANAEKLGEINPTTYGTYAGIWLLPNLSGGSKAVGITIAGGSNGFTALEIAGLGPNPGADSNGGVSVGYGSNSATSMPSGNLPALATSNELILGTGAAYGVGTYTTPSGWANLPNASFSTVQYLISGSVGAQYQYDPSGGNTGWGSLIVAIEKGTESINVIKYNTGVAAAVTGNTQIQFTIPNTGGLNNTGVQVGDVMLLDYSCFTEDSIQPTITFSGGGGNWKLMPMTDGSTNPQLCQQGAIYCYNFAYFRVATSADIGAIITITEAGSPVGTTWLGVAMTAYTGANQLNPIDRASGTADSNSSPSVTCPTENARISEDWAVYLCGGGFDISASITGPAGTIQRQFATNSGGTGAVINDSNGPTGINSIGGGTFTSNIGNAFLGAFTVALAPAGIYVVQTSNSSTWSGNLSANATPGNTLFMFPVAYAVPANTSSSDPTYNNFAQVPGTTQIWSVQSNSGSNDMYSALWMLPNLPSSSTSFAINISGGSQPSPLCANLLLEVQGLGPNPIIDQTGTAAGSNGNSSLGPTGSTNSANELILACGAVYGAYPSNGPVEPWNSFTDINNQHAIVSWQTSSSSGKTFSWEEDGNGAPWAGGIATIRIPVWSIDSSTPAVTTSAAGNPSIVTSAAFSPPAGSVIAALVSSGFDGSPTPVMQYAISDNSGGKLTWTTRTPTPAPINTHDAFAQVITATVPAGGISDLTITAQQSGGFGYGGGPIVILPLVINGVQEAGGYNSGSDISNTNPADVLFIPLFNDSLPVFAMQSTVSSQFAQSLLNAYSNSELSSSNAIAEGYYSGLVRSNSGIGIGSVSSVSNQGAYIAVYELPLSGTVILANNSGILMVGVV